MKVLLSIKPEFVEAIFSGEKKYEYRRSIFKREVTKVIIYATKPIGKIVGEFDIEEILEEEPKKIWEKTKNYSGISKEFYYEYFFNRNKAYAIKIKTVIKYETPLCPYQNYSDFKAPQSFRYWS